MSIGISFCSLEFARSSIYVRRTCVTVFLIPHSTFSTQFIPLTGTIGPWAELHDNNMHLGGVKTKNLGSLQFKNANQVIS